jgi:hypothetical protein
MSTTSWLPSDTERAKKFWDDYAASHDLSDRIGQAAGIDPVSGEIWFGVSASEIACRLMDAGTFRPLFYVRVGFPAYQRKGGRR